MYAHPFSPTNALLLFKKKNEVDACTYHIDLVYPPEASGCVVLVVLFSEPFMLAQQINLEPFV